MKHIIKIDVDAFPAGLSSTVMAGPEMGIDSCTVLYSRVPAHHEDRQVRVCPVDRLYYTVSGSLSVQLGTDVFKTEPGVLVLVPAGTPYAVSNDGAEDELHLELLVPALEPDEKPQAAEPRPVKNAAALVRHQNQLEDSDIFNPTPGFMMRRMAHRGSGSAHAAVGVADLQQAASGAKMHFHDFDQFYFVLDGSLDIQIGNKKMSAGPNSLVILPAGTLHANFNAGPAAERHIALNVPESNPGERIEHPVEILSGHQAV